MRKHPRHWISVWKIIPYLILVTILFASYLWHLGFQKDIARASGVHVYTVMNTSETLPDGVWFRRSAHISDTDRVIGHGVYMGNAVHVLCYLFGDAVGPYSNRLWYYVSNITHPTLPDDTTPNVGFLNAHYINDGASANQVDAEVPICTMPPGISFQFPLPNPIWSGYSATGKQFSDVQASWKVAGITCGSNEFSHAYTWIGLGGMNSSPLEQIGTDAICVNGSPAYYAWWEILPEFPETMPIPSAAHIHMLTVGATITADVSYKGGGTYHLFIAENGITLLSQYMHGSPDPTATNAADFIVERVNSPSYRFSTFQSISFTSCSVDGGSITSAPGLMLFTLSYSGGILLDRVSSLDTTDTAFSTTWLHN